MPKNGFLRLTLMIMTVGIVIFFLFAFQAVYWIFFDDNPPIKQFIEPLPVAPAVVQPGGILSMTADYCRFTDAPADFSSWWENVDTGDIFQVTNTRQTLGAGCSKVTLNLQIPNNMPPGQWKRINVGIYQVNPLSRREVRWESEVFTVQAIEVLP